jgi:hypothetical protein
VQYLLRYAIVATSSLRRIKGLTVSAQGTYGVDIPRA